MLTTKKFERPIFGTFWERKFEINIHKCEWKEIYKNKVFENVERKIAEFNYKLLFRLIPCNFWLHKDKLKDNKTCVVCGQVETLEHLYFDCARVKNIWSLISNKLKIQIKHKHIVLGYYCETNTLTTSLNNLISLVLYTIYKHWCIIDREQEKHFLTCHLQKKKSKS